MVECLQLLGTQDKYFPRVTLRLGGKEALHDSGLAVLHVCMQMGCSDDAVSAAIERATIVPCEGDPRGSEAIISIDSPHSCL